MTGINISIHAPLAGRDHCCRCTRCCCSKFQSTRPLRGATTAGTNTGSPIPISIHAPLAGRDRQGEDQRSPRLYFNPRAPCGARRGGFPAASSLQRFQSTRPLRGATAQASQFSAVQEISIHAPLAGRDTVFADKKSVGFSISIHAPLAGRDKVLPCLSPS